MKECDYKKVFVGTKVKSAECPYEYPECMRKIEEGYCVYFDKCQEYLIDARVGESEETE